MFMSSLSEANSFPTFFIIYIRRSSVMEQLRHFHSIVFVCTQSSTVKKPLLQYGFVKNYFYRRAINNVVCPVNIN